MPERTASAWNTQSGVSCDMRANPVPAAGIMSNAVVKKIVFRPPAIRIRKLLGILRVAPVSPAIAEVALQGWKVPMDANLYEIPDESDITEDAVEWLYAYQWCMFNNTRCGNDQQ